MSVDVKRWGVAFAVRAVLPNRHVTTLAALKLVWATLRSGSHSTGWACVLQSCLAAWQGQTPDDSQSPYWDFPVCSAHLDFHSLHDCMDSRKRWMERKWSENISLLLPFIYKNCFLLSGISLKDSLAIIMALSVSESAWMWPGSALRGDWFSDLPVETIVAFVPAVFCIGKGTHRALTMLD